MAVAEMLPQPLNQVVQTGAGTARLSIEDNPRQAIYLIIAYPIIALARHDGANLRKFVQSRKKRRNPGIYFGLFASYLNLHLAMERLKVLTVYWYRFHAAATFGLGLRYFS
jgi:hypothetical protein